jgi:branched-chain amino acid aminotransferase
MARHFINFNGDFYADDQPVMDISNRSFRYGDGIFESMRWAKGELKYADLHASRIRRGMELLKLQGDLRIDHRFLCDKVEELVRKNKIGLNARVRLTIFRHAGGLYSPTGNEVGYALDVIKLDEFAYVSNPPGLIVDVFDEVPKPINILSNIKTCSALLFVLAGIFKNQFSLDEVLIVNQNGFLCEAMSSNVFVVYKKKIYTPALSEGCVEGVMRSVVMRLAADNGLEVIEAQINPEILHEADEIFLTNVSKGIRWVMGFNNKRYFNEVSRFLASKLQ